MAGNGPIVQQQSFYTIIIRIMHKSLDTCFTRVHLNISAIKISLDFPPFSI